MLTGSEVLVIVGSQTGRVHTFGTPKLQPLLTQPVPKTFIEACLSSTDGSEAITNLNHAMDEELERRFKLKETELETYGKDQTLPSMPPDEPEQDCGYVSAPSRPSSAMSFGFPFPQHAAAQSTFSMPWIMPENQDDTTMRY